jgi:hypothetical protein
MSRSPAALGATALMLKFFTSMFRTVMCGAWRRTLSAVTVAPGAGSKTTWSARVASLLPLVDVIV